MSVFCLHSKVKSPVDLPSGVPGRKADRLRGRGGGRREGLGGEGVVNCRPDGHCFFLFCFMENFSKGRGSRRGEEVAGVCLVFRNVEVC